MLELGMVISFLPPKSGSGVHTARRRSRQHTFAHGGMYFQNRRKQNARSVENWLSLFKIRHHGLNLVRLADHGVLLAGFGQQDLA